MITTNYKSKVYSTEVFINGTVNAPALIVVLVYRLCCECKALFHYSLINFSGRNHSKSNKIKGNASDSTTYWSHLADYTGK